MLIFMMPTNCVNPSDVMVWLLTLIGGWQVIVLVQGDWWDCYFLFLL